MSTTMPSVMSNAQDVQADLRLRFRLVRRRSLRLCETADA